LIAQSLDSLNSRFFFNLPNFISNVQTAKNKKVHYFIFTRNTNSVILKYLYLQILLHIFLLLDVWDQVTFINFIFVRCVGSWWLLSDQFSHWRSSHVRKKVRHTTLVKECAKW